MDGSRSLRTSVALWIGIGLAVREAFSFWTGLPYDSEVWLRNAYYVAHGWYRNVYMPPVPGISFAYLGTSIGSVGYLPLWSVLLAGLYHLFALFPGNNRFLLYFLIKQPPILGDVLLGVLLFKAAKRWGAASESARRLLSFWMLFPYAILISAIWGQFDGLVAAIWLAALLAVASWKRSSLLGLGILLKTLPVIFLPYFAFGGKGRSRWGVALAVAVPVGFTAGLFLLMGWVPTGLSGTVTWQAHSYPQGMTYWRVLTSPWFLAALPPSGGVLTLLGYLWIPAVFGASVWAARRFPLASPEALVQAVLFLLTIFFLFRWVVNEQYLIYLLPLLLLDVALWHPERRGLLHWTWILGLAFLVLNNVFLVRFAAPISPGALPFEAGLLSNPMFSSIRDAILVALGILMSLHFVQLVLVIRNPARATRPWPIEGAIRAFSAPARRIRGLIVGR